MLIPSLLQLMIRFYAYSFPAPLRTQLYVRSVKPSQLLSAGNSMQVDLGGSKACLRLGHPYGRYSSREGRQVKKKNRYEQEMMQERKSRHTDFADRTFV